MAGFPPVRQLRGTWERKMGISELRGNLSPRSRWGTVVDGSLAPAAERERADATGRRESAIRWKGNNSVNCNSDRVSKKNHYIRQTAESRSGVTSPRDIGAGRDGQREMGKESRQRAMGRKGGGWGRRHRRKNAGQGRGFPLASSTGWEHFPPVGGDRARPVVEGHGSGCTCWKGKRIWQGL